MFLIDNILINFKTHFPKKLNLNHTYLHLKVNSLLILMAIYYGFLLLNFLLKQPTLCL